MPDTACLHIQARESDPIRVVELPGTSVRIGRASFCEVRLAEPDLADEECRLRRRGSGWQLVPSRAAGFVWIDGRSVEETCPLPFDVPFRVGEHWLTLRSSGNSAPDWGEYRAPGPLERPRSASSLESVRLEPLGDPIATAAEFRPATAHVVESRPATQAYSPPEPDRLARWKMRQESQPSRVRVAQEEKRWEERWRAAGERLRAKAQPASPVAAPPTPTPPPPGPSPRDPGARRRETFGGASLRAAPTARFGRVARKIEPAEPAAPLLPRTPHPPAPTAPVVPPPAPSLPEADLRRYAPPPIAPREHPAAFDWSAPPLADAPAAPFTRPVSPSPLYPLFPEIEARQAAPVANPFAPAVESPALEEAAPDVVPGVPAPAVEGTEAIDRLAEPADDESKASPEPDLEENAPEAALAAPTEPEVAAPPFIDAPPAPADSEADAEETEVAATAPGFDDLSEGGIEDRQGARLTPHPGPPPQGGREEDGSRPSSWVEDGSTRPLSEEFGAPPPLRGRVRVGGESPDVPNPEANPSAEAHPAHPEPGPVREPAAWARPDPFVTHTSATDPAAATEPLAGSADDFATTVEHACGVDRRAADPSRRASRVTSSSPRPGPQARAAVAPVSAPEPGEHADEPRPEPEPRHPDASREWPSVQDILRAHASTANTTSTRQPPRRAGKSQVVPTEAREPASWSLPLWLGWFPSAAFVAGAGLAAVALSSAWSADARSAGSVADLLTRGGSEVKPLPDTVVPPNGSWWKSTASHLMLWSYYFDKRAAAEPLNADLAEELLNAAAKASPLQAPVRFALSRRGAGGEPALLPTLGLSRDIVALTWSARQWYEAGKKDAALKSYRAALEMAAAAALEHAAAPAFDDDPQIKRYRLPGEDLVSQVVRDMSERDGWSFAEWSHALPPSALVHVAAARVLREHGSPDAQTALEAVLNKLDEPPAAGTPLALHRAAQAEALALTSRWKEAEPRYREAIALMSRDVVKRSWWMNLAEVAQRLNDEEARQKSLESAKGESAHDEIAERAIEQLRYLRNPAEEARSPG
jgi:hypothetical protein